MSATTPPIVADKKPVVLSRWPLLNAAIEYGIVRASAFIARFTYGLLLRA